MQILRAGSLIFLICASSTAVAQDWFFDGEIGNPGDWNDPLNWDVDTVPGLPDPMMQANVIIGHAAPGVSPATANISGPLTEPIVGDLRIGAGETGGAIGTVNHSAGSLTTNPGNWAFVGLDGPAGAPNQGTYNLSGTAVFNNDAQLHIGLGGGAGASNQGLVTVAGNATMNLNEFYVGSNDGNTGTVDQAGGTVNFNVGYVGDATFGVGATGVYNQTGGDVVVQDWMAIGRTGNANGTYNMSGGTLFVGTDYLTVGENAGATGVMNVSGTSEIDAANLAVGRFGGGASGTLSIEGDQASIETFVLQVGRNDQNDFNPEDVTGTLRFVSSSADVSPVNVLGDVYLNDGSVIGSGNLEVDLTGSSTASEILLVSVGGVLDGTFAGLPEGAAVPGSGGRVISYVGGDGNDIVLVTGGVVDGDFNSDGFYNCADVDQLVVQIVSGNNDVGFDLTSDGLVNGDDLSAWLVEGGANNPAATGVAPFLVGDANLDGVVDVPDFNVWNSSKFTVNPAWCSGDFNADGVVDVPDFNLWNAAKFTSSAGNPATVPEPAWGLSWLLWGLMAVCWRRRRVN